MQRRSMHNVAQCLKWGPRRGTGKLYYGHPRRKGGESEDGSKPRANDPSEGSGILALKRGYCLAAPTLLKSSYSYNYTVRGFSLQTATAMGSHGPRVPGFQRVACSRESGVMDEPREVLDLTELSKAFPETRLYACRDGDGLVDARTLAERFGEHDQGGGGGAGAEHPVSVQDTDALRHALTDAFHKRDVAGASLLALQSLQHGYQYARDTLVQSFWAAVWEAQDTVDDHQRVGKIWERLMKPSDLALPAHQDARHNVAQCLLCLIHGAPTFGLDTLCIRSDPPVLDFELFVRDGEVQRPHLRMTLHLDIIL